MPTDKLSGGIINRLLVLEFFNVRNPQVKERQAIHMEIIDKYLDEVCACITNVPYRRAARRELQNHIADSMEYAKKSGLDSEDAAKHILFPARNIMKIDTI